jgi:hypothetical protein
MAKGKYKQITTSLERQIWERSVLHVIDVFHFVSEKLINKNIIIKTKEETITVRIVKSNLPHLLGIDYQLGYEQLWRDAIRGRIDMQKILIKSDGTTLQKLSALRSFIDLFTGNSRLVKDAKYERLYINRGIRTNKQLLALGLIDRFTYYVPNTALNLKNKYFDSGSEILIIYTEDRKTGAIDILKISPRYDKTRL